MKKSEITKDCIPKDIILNAILNYGSDIAIVIAKDFTIELLNSTSEKFYKWSLERVRGNNFLELCQEQRIFCPIPSHFFKHPELLSFNLDCKNASGNACNINWIIYPLILDDHIKGALIIGKDIERKKNNIAYFLNGIIDAIPGCLYWKDCNGYYLGCNNLTAKLAGLSSPYEVIGKTDEDLWGKQAGSLIVNDTAVMTQGNAILVEESLKTASGQLMHFTGVKMPLRDENNQIIGIIGNSLDITELKEAQTKLKKSMELVKAANFAKTEFLENMRHDIRTPLSGIVGFSEILKQESQEPRIKEYADNLAASSHALLDLMDEVLEAVRVSSGEIPKLKKKFDLNLLLNQVIDLHKAKASEKKLQLNFIYDDHLPQYVIGDKIRLHRIILELIGNALNFTHSGHVTLTAELAKQQKRQLIIKFQVTDSGIGIDKDKQQDIYLQFKRLTPSYKGLYKGAGLGLYIIKQFIDELEGEIYVKSALDCGTTFTCIIPLKAPLLDDNSGIEELMPAEEQRFLNPVRTLAANPNQPNSVLVVEDSEIAQKVALAILTSMDCVVDLASSGQEALQHIKTKRYDLIFMDIGLGEGADGYEVTKQIRNQEKDKDHTPIVALTAHAAEENKQHCIESGMDAVLSKPITKTHASNILDHFVRHPETLEREKIEQAKLDLPDNEEEFFTLEQFPLLEVEQTLRNLGDKSILIELLNDLVTASIPEDFTRMKEAFAAKDYEQVEKIAHKMKGGAVYVGTLRMKYACQYLERYWKSGQRVLFEKLYQQAVLVIDETRSYVKNWLNSNNL